MFIFRKDNWDQLGTIVSVLGTRDFYDYVSTIPIEWTPELRQVLAKVVPSSLSPSSWHPGMAGETLENHQHHHHQYHHQFHHHRYNNKNPDWSKWYSSDGFIPSPEGIDLVSKLLVYDPQKRWTAEQAMRHPFFDRVRSKIEHEMASRTSHDDDNNNDHDSDHNHVIPSSSHHTVTQTSS